MYHLNLYSCRTVALWKNFLLTDRRATVPPTVKTVYLLCTKSCARFGLNFSIFLLCQVKIPDEKNSIHVYLLGKNIIKPLVHFDQPLQAFNSPGNVVDKFSSSNLLAGTGKFIDYICWRISGRKWLIKVNQRFVYIFY